MNPYTSCSHKNNREFYKGKRVLVTGHTGFKGAWLTVVLKYLEADSLGYALTAEKNSLYDKMHGDAFINSVTGDLLDYELLKTTIDNFRPEIVIHLAAFGFVKECFENPVRAYQTNLLGSANLLEAIRNCPSVKSVVMISTDKVYENKGDGVLYSEQDRLVGAEPYSSSKTCMEFLVNDYKNSYFQTDKKLVGVATVRASNVLAGGDHVNTRLIPTILQSVSIGKPIELRHPSQTRPWQSVLDALDGYLSIARMLYNNPKEYSEAWNIGPTQDGIRTVAEVFEGIEKQFNGLKLKHGEKLSISEAETLGLDIHKSLERLDWKPSLSFEKVIKLVVEFYKRQQEGENEYEICLNQIFNFYQ